MFTDAQKAEALARIAGGERQSDVAKDLGISTSSVSRWARTRKFRDPDFAMSIESARKEAVTQAWDGLRLAYSVISKKLEAADITEDTRKKVLDALTDGGSIEAEDADRLVKLTEFGASLSAGEVQGLAKTLFDQQAALQGDDAADGTVKIVIGDVGESYGG